jgi:acyl-CoA thioester hydrolase
MDGGSAAAPPPTDEQPQGESRRKAGFRGRNLRHTKTAAVVATINNAVVSCQSMQSNIPTPWKFATPVFFREVSNSGWLGLVAELRQEIGKLLSFNYGRAMIASTFGHEQRVTYAHCTAGDHIYYARYLDILETARGEFFRHLGQTFLSWQGRGVVFPVIESHLRYKEPAHYDDLLLTELWITKAEKVRLTFAYRVLKPDRQLILEATTAHVCTSLQNRPKRLPVELLAALQPYLNTTNLGSRSSDSEI